MATGPKTDSSSIDVLLVAAILALLAFGLVMIYSASAVAAGKQLHNASFFLGRQAIYATLGVVLMLITSRIDYRRWAKLVYPLLIAAFLGLLLCHAPIIGRTVNGASRWISLGPLTLQPAELAKIALVLWLSFSLVKKTEKIRSFSIGFLPHLLIPGVFIVACLAQPDFGTSMVIVLVAFALLFVAGAKLGYILGAVLASLPLVYIAVASSEYRWKRVVTFLDPLAVRQTEGYQLTQSFFGFASGGVTGVGIGDGRQKLLFLPEAHNDFIAAIIGEELGLVGVWLLMALVAFVVARGVRIALKAPDRFGTYVAFGLTLLVGLQALINLGVTMGLLPTKGLNLPFVSYGGSALVLSLWSMGILLNISRGEGPIATFPESRGSQGNVRRSPGEPHEEVT